ncbi:MAG TPA: nuclear transport factor 2 family protein [Gemmatimonadaceae bacterium]|nr:nuclear transport factor 2 family protein [Gemmatimonadaceae bacterium]
MHRLLAGAVLVGVPLSAVALPSVHPDSMLPPRAPAHAPAAPATPSAAMEQFAARWTADDRVGVTALLADSVALLGRSPLVGREAVLGWARQQMASTGALRITREAGHRLGDQAYEVGRWSLELAGAAGVEHGGHLFRFQRRRDGTWKIIEMYIINDPAAAGTTGQ